MIGKKLVSQKNVPLFEMKEILAERSKEGELNYEQQQAFDYSKKFLSDARKRGKAFEGIAGC